MLYSRKKKKQFQLIFQHSEIFEIPLKEKDITMNNYEAQRINSLATN